jgi:hypothetical protein
MVAIAADPLDLSVSIFFHHHAATHKAQPTRGLDLGHVTPQVATDSSHRLCNRVRWPSSEFDLCKGTVCLDVGQARCSIGSARRLFDAFCSGIFAVFLPSTAGTPPTCGIHFSKRQGTKVFDGVPGALRRTRE